MGELPAPLGSGRVPRSLPRASQFSNQLALPAVDFHDLRPFTSKHSMSGEQGLVGRIINRRFVKEAQRVAYIAQPFHKALRQFASERVSRLRTLARQFFDR